jgi:lipoteichoic acid synthase
VLVVLESTAAQYLRPYGATDDPMPHLSALASRSVLFERAYAAYPESIKGLFATLCSKYPAFDVPVEDHVAAPCTSLTHVLSRAGYRTAIFHSGRFAYLGMAALVTGQRFDVAQDAGAIGGVVRSSFGVDEASAVRSMLGWIDGLSRDQPFFLTYLPAAGHHPYATNRPGPFAGDNEMAAYKNAIFEGDASLGTLLDGLRERELDDDTLFVVMADHGEAFGQHDGNAGHTIFIYEENVRVPMLISMPGVILDQVRVDRTASVIDVAPTILDLVGLPVPSGHQGTSLLVPRDRLALFYTDYSLGWLGLRDGCWKFLFETRARRPYLFDVCADPEERLDRSAAEPARVTAYRDRLESWSSATRAAIGR